MHCICTYTNMKIGYIWKIVASWTPKLQEKSDRDDKIPKQREAYMTIGMRHAHHFALACMSISDIHKTKERGTLSQHLTEWSSPIQFGTRKKMFSSIESNLGQVEKSSKNYVVQNKLNLGASQGLFFVFKNKLSKRIEPRDKPRYRICFQNWPKWIKPRDKPRYQV